MSLLLAIGMGIGGFALGIIVLMITIMYYFRDVYR